MPYSRFVVDNPALKGFKIERRSFGVLGEHYERMLLVVPLAGVGNVWWQRDTSGISLLGTGKALISGDKRSIQTIIGADQKTIPGDEPGTLIEIRCFRSLHHKKQMLLVCSPNPVSGFLCESWWEKDGETPVLCSGMRASANAKVPDGDGLDHKTRNELLTIAGLAGIKKAQDMQDGEVIESIRAVRKEKKQVTQGASK